MEVWILLAAAGSGYLSRRWQNAPQTKPPSLPSSPFATSSEKEEGSRRQVRPFVTPKGCGRNKFSLGKEFIVRRRSNRLKTSNPNPQVKAEEEASTSLFGSSVTEENGRKDCYNFANPSPSLECHPQCSFSSKEENKPLLGEKLPEAQRLNRSGKRGNGGVGEFVEGKEVGFGKRLKDSPIKRGGEEEERDREDLIPSIQTKEVLDMKGALEEELMSVGNLMTGLWDTSLCSFSDGLFLDSTSRQKSGARSSSRGPGSRRSKTPNKFGRKNAIRPKKILSSSVSKPMSSLESCLSAQLLQDTEKSAKKDHAHLLTHSLLNGSERHLNLSGHQCKETPMSQLKTLMEIKESRYGGGSLEEGSSSSGPPSLEKCGHENKVRACTSLGKRVVDNKDGSQVISSSESLALQGHESILFNFGVGVGMMFAANSYRNEMKAVMDTLEQMEGLLKDIGTETNVSETIAFHDVEIIQSKNELDQNWKQDGALNTWTKVRSLFEVLKTSVHLKLKKERSLTSGSRDMKKLEAELETELERINIIGLHPSSFFELSSRFQVANKVEVGSVVYGELSTDTIPLGESVELEEGGSCSSDEEVLPTYAVSPQELERRLYRVLEARHEERIAELEAELYGYRQKLQGKEKELLWWKEHICHSRDVTCYDDIASTENDRGMKGDKGFSLHQSTLSLNERCNSIEATLESVGEALDVNDEACDEFLRVLSDDSEGEVLRNGATESDTNGKRLFPNTSLVMMPNKKPLPDTSKVALTEGRGGSFLPSKLLNLVEDNVSNDTPAMSTPCSIKLIDASMPTTHLSRNSPSSGIDTHSPSWDEEDLLYGVESYFLTTTDEHLPPFSLNHPPNPRSNTDSVASIRSKYWDQEDSLIGDFESLGVFDDDEEDDASDSDEQMGIIKRIVEKARKGSPIVQEARTALSALEQTD